MKPRRVITTVVLILFVSGLGLMSSWPTSANQVNRDKARQADDVARIRNLLERKVIETGYVDAAKSVEIRSNLDEPTAIIFIVAEGTRVKAGDHVAQLDSSTLELKFAQQKITAANAKARFVSAETELATAKELQNVLGKLDDARVKAAVQRQQSYLVADGVYKLKYDRLKTQLDLARTRVDSATNYIRRLENSEKDEFAMAAAYQQLSDARAQSAALDIDLRLLEEHEKPNETADREIAVWAAQARQIENRNELAKRVQDASAELAATKSAYELGEQQLKSLEQQIQECTLKSPQAGVVVYANQLNRRGGADFLVEEGALVRPRQTIVYLPDMSHLQVRIAVNETRISRIRPGQPVNLRFDAFNQVNVPGKVTRINPFPEPETFGNSGVKRYGVTVSIIDPPNSIRIGMTAFAEIDVSEKPEN